MKSKAHWAQQLLRLPRRRAIALVVAPSTLLSLLVTGVIEVALGRTGTTMLIYMGVALVIPLLVATPIASIVFKLLDELNTARQDAERLAHTDMLTGVLNRRRFVELAERELQRGRHEGQVCSVLLLDADDFKRINDRHGHETGDAVLRLIAQLAFQTLRPDDPFARWGGEEFVALLPRTGGEAALAVARQVRAAIAAGEACCEGRRLTVTVSIGVASSQALDESLDSLIHRADVAMYRAKTAGKNAVVQAGAEEPLSPELT